MRKRTRALLWAMRVPPAAASGRLVSCGSELHLYANRGQTHTFYQALKRFEDAAKEIKEREFKERELKERTAVIEALEQELGAIREKRKVDDLRREQLEQLREVAPLLQTIATHESALETWAGIGALSERELARLRKALTDADQADSALERLVEEHEDAERCAESFVIERELLAEAASIQSVQGQTGAYTERKVRSAEYGPRAISCAESWRACG
jgi:DNA repair ATPase RecN